MQSDIYLSAMTRKFGGVPGIRRLTRPLRAHYARKYAARPDRLVTIEDYDGDLRMTVDRSTYIGGSIYWNRHHHVGELRYLKAALRPEMTFLDVGANQGEFTLPVAKRLTRGRVLAFEPEDEMYRMLGHNVVQNGFANVRLFHFGLGNEASRRPLYTSDDAVRHNGWNEGQFSTFRNDALSTYVQDIEIRRIDDVLAENAVERVDYIKIDVEGAELHVLQGAEHTLRRFRPKILIEINHETFAAAGYSTPDLLDFLSDHGYAFRHIDRWGATAPARRGRIASEARTINILCA